MDSDTSRLELSGGAGYIAWVLTGNHFFGSNFREDGTPRDACVQVYGCFLLQRNFFAGRRGEAGVFSTLFSRPSFFLSRSSPFLFVCVRITN